LCTSKINIVDLLVASFYISCRQIAPRCKILSSTKYSAEMTQS